MDRTIALVVLALAIGGTMTYQGFANRHAAAGSAGTASEMGEASAVVSGRRVATSAGASVSASAGSSTATSRDPIKTCLPKDLRLDWPLRGVAEKDWYIANYFDQDPMIHQTRDYTGAVGPLAVTYDGHKGIDIEIASFKGMDVGFPIYASAAGVVEAVHDGSFDRNMTCTEDEWNFVKIRHPNGYATLYGHAKNGSVIVRPGDRVSAGTKLANVGSSGCSGYPHLHIEAVDCGGQSVDIMKENLFIVNPGYAPLQPATLMETLVRQPVINAVADIQDPGLAGDKTNITLGVAFSTAMTVSHLKVGDVIRIDFIDPLNQPSTLFFEKKMEKPFARSHWWSDFILDKAGSWLVQFKINDHVVATTRLSASE